MREFFNPWRRKFGIVTLVLACAITAMWVRGFRTEDDYDFGSGKEREYHRLECSANGIRWSIHFSVDATIYNPGWSSFSYQGPDHLGGYIQQYKIAWRWRHFGFDLGEIRFPANKDRVAFWLIPYWSIVLPLTLLSAWLVLSKPRPSVPKTTEPPKPDHA